MPYRIQIRRDTASNWTSANPTLYAGEVGYETDTGKMKFGDGTTAWTSLSYFVAAPPNGDKGDITVSSSGATWTIDNDAVTFAKMQNIATDRLLGRDTASTGDVEELTVGNGLAFTGSGGIGIANDGVTYARIQNVSAASKLLGRGDSGSGDVEEITLGSGLTMTGTTLSSSGGGGVSDGPKGDITVSSSGATWTIDNDAVTYAKIQNVSATDRLLGRSSSGAGDVEEITCTAAGRAILDDASASAQRTTLSAAPNSAYYVVTQPSAELSNAADLGALSTGILKSTSSLGVATVSIATGTDLPSHTHATSDIVSVTTDRLIGRDTASTGAAEQITVGGGIEFTGSGGIQTSAFTGDVTKSAGSTSTTIATASVTYAKMQDVSAASRLLGRGSASGSGDVEEISLGTGLTMSGTTLSSSVGSTVTVTEFTYTTSGTSTYTKPTGLEYIIVEGVGGGGGGGDGSTSAGGTGGCAGAYDSVVIDAATITTATLDVIIGSGGTTAGGNGGNSSVELTGGACLVMFAGGAGATTSARTILGTALSGGFGAGNTTGNAGRVGGRGAGGGGGGSSGVTGAGAAGGEPCKATWSSATAAATGGGAAGGAAGGGGGAGTSASVTVRGIGEGAGGGAGSSTAAGGAGGNGTRGSGGGGGGRCTSGTSAGGVGGDGFVRIIEVKVT